MFITLYYPSASQEIIDWHNENFQKLGPAKNMEPVIDLVSRIDIRGELAKIRAPALFFHCRIDGNVPLVAGKQAAEGISNARFVELESPNHILLQFEPAWPVLVREMRAFLAARDKVAA
jgi:pimeloyl-ACP methyl ester carboxylesterase